MKKLDARKHYAPERGPELIEQAVKATGSYIELAHRAGVNDSYLRQIRRHEKRMSFGLQVILEQIAKEVKQ